MSGFTIETRGAVELQARLAALGNDLPNAVLRAVNRTRPTVVTRMLRWLVSATGLPQKRLRKSMRSFPATRAEPVAGVSLYGGRTPLIHYRQAIQREHLPPSGFRVKVPGSGHVGLFVRRSTSRHRRKGEPFAPHELPIDQVLGPRFTEFITGVGMTDLLRYADARLLANLEHEIAFRESRQPGAA